MNNIKRFHSPSFKAQVALDLIKEVESVSQICSKHSIHPTQAKKWKTQVLASLPTVFEDKFGNRLLEKDQLIEELYQQIGRQKVELDWLKKKTGSG